MKDWLCRRRTMTEILADIDLQTDEEQVARIRADMEDKAPRLPLHRHEQTTGRSAEKQGDTGSCRNTSRSSSSKHTAPSAVRSRPVKDNKGVWSISRVPPDLRKLPDNLERQVRQDRQRLRADNLRQGTVVGYSDLEFVGPGHPLFEGVVERVLQDYGSSLRQGAVFFNADATEPTVLWLLKCGVEDGPRATW